MRRLRLAGSTASAPAALPASPRCTRQGAHRITFSYIHVCAGNIRLYALEIELPAARSIGRPNAHARSLRGGRRKDAGGTPSDDTGREPVTQWARLLSSHCVLRWNRRKRLLPRVSRPCNSVSVYLNPCCLCHRHRPVRVPSCKLDEAQEMNVLMRKSWRFPRACNCGGCRKRRDVPCPTFAISR